MQTQSDNLILCDIRTSAHVNRQCKLYVTNLCLKSGADGCPILEIQLEIKYHLQVIPTKTCYQFESHVPLLSYNRWHFVSSSCSRGTTFTLVGTQYPLNRLLSKLALLSNRLGKMRLDVLNEEVSTKKSESAQEADQKMSKISKRENVHVIRSGQACTGQDANFSNVIESRGVYKIQ